VVKNGTIFGDWELNCRATGVDETLCGISQTLTLTETKALIASVTLQEVLVDDQIGMQLVLNTPTNVRLNVNAGYRFEGESDTRPLNWDTCNQAFCIARYMLEVDEIDVFKRGDKLLFGYQLVDKPEPVTFHVSLNGVTAGLDSFLD